MFIRNRFSRPSRSGEPREASPAGVKVQSIYDMDLARPIVYQLLVGPRNSEPNPHGGGEQGSMSLAVPGLIAIGYIGLLAAQETWGSYGQWAMGAITTVAVVAELLDRGEVQEPVASNWHS